MTTEPKTKTKTKQKRTTKPKENSVYIQDGMVNAILNGKSFKISIENYNTLVDLIQSACENSNIGAAFMDGNGYLHAIVINKNEEELKNE